MSAGRDPAQDAWDFGALWFLSWAEGEYGLVCCSLELLIYSVGDLTVSIPSCECGRGKAPFGFRLVPSIIPHHFSCVANAFYSQPPRCPLENTDFPFLLTYFSFPLPAANFCVSPADGEAGGASAGVLGALWPGHIHPRQRSSLFVARGGWIGAS